MCKDTLAYSLMIVLAVCASKGIGETIYVDASSGGLNNGSSWTDAYNSLQGALDTADPCDQIWVAEGMYLPSKQTDPCEPRTATFQLASGVGLYGGFPNSGDPTWNDRDPHTYVTILSGDLLDNNTFGQLDISDACDFVAVAAGAAHSLGLKTDGSVVGWGWDGYGQITVSAPQPSFYLSLVT